MADFLLQRPPPPCLLGGAPRYDTGDESLRTALGGGGLGMMALRGRGGCGDFGGVATHPGDRAAS